MQSLFGQLFLAIQEQIKTQVGAIQWIDQDLGQLDSFEIRPAVAFPCVLIDFVNTQYKEHMQNVQWADITVIVRLGFAPFSSANSATPDIPKEAALEYYELEHALFEALQGFTANDCVQPMIRVSAATERREDFLRVRELIFTTATEDDTIKIPVQLQKAELELSQGE